MRPTLGRSMLTFNRTQQHTGNTTEEVADDPADSGKIVVSKVKDNPNTQTKYSEQVWDRTLENLRYLA